MTRRISLVLFLTAIVLLIAGLSSNAEAAQVNAEGDACRLPNQPNGFVIQSGFPLHPAIPATTGTYRAVVLFADFADRPATVTPQEMFDGVWPDAEAYIESLSHDQIDFVVEPHLQWLTFAANEDFYSLGAGGSDSSALLADAVALADPAVDFSTFDSVWVLSPRDRWSGEAWQSGHPSLDLIAESGNKRFQSAVIGGIVESQIALPEDQFNQLMAHEVIHTLGLPDLYDWERDRQVPPEEANRFVGNFSPMGLTSGVSGQFGFFSIRNGNELFAWEQWQLGWLQDQQINCSDRPSIQRVLSPAAHQNGDKAITVRTGDTTALVVETRAKLRWDADMDRSGVLVYTVDSSISSGDGPLRVQGSYPGLWADSSVLLQPGESRRVGDHVVSVLAPVGDGFEVRVYELRCQGRLVTIDMNQNGGDGNGTNSRDVILGTPDDDVIVAGGGNDVVCGGGGNDTIYGNTGPDILAGEAGADTIYGGSGDDTIHGNRGNDMLFGQDGHDRIFGYANNDLIEGGDGDDRLHGNFGDDTINAGEGDDRVFGYGDNDTIDLGPGNDLAGGNFGDDSITGGDGDDTIYGSDGADVVRGGAGNDQLSGNSGADALFGDAGADTLDGGINDDRCDGGAGIDTAERCETVVAIP